MKNEETDSLLVESWLTGFLSGMNAQRVRLQGRRSLPLPKNTFILLYVDKYCQDNPDKTPFTGAITLYMELEDDADH